MFGQKFSEFSCILVLLFSTPSFGAADTLRDSLRNAYQNSGLLVQNRALLRAADEKVAGAVAALRPVISWSSKYSYSSSGVGSPNVLTDRKSVV